MNILWRLLYRATPSLYKFGQNLHTLAFGYGQWQTIRRGIPLDAASMPLPWYTYPAIEYLSQFDFAGWTVFEFGGGNSSLFWAGRAARVVTVENDASWFERLQRRSAPNQRMLLRQERAAYVAALAEQSERFDIVAIDGEWRHACARAAVGCVRERGMIILDNSDKFPGVADFLRGQDFFEIDFSGFGPVNNYTWTTSMFVRSPLPLQTGFRPPRPVGGRDVTVGPDDEDNGTTTGQTRSR